MAGRKSYLAAIAFVITCESVTFAVVHGEEPGPPPAEPAAIDTLPTAAPAISTSTPVRQSQGNIARIWANEPPLVRLARDHFAGDFTDNDAKFFAAVAANDWADFRPAADATFDAEKPSSWAEAPSLKADRIAWLCTDANAARLVPKRGIWLRGASIEGKIDLYRADVPFSLTMYDCLLSAGLSLEHAKVQEIDIRNSCSAMIMAQGVEVRENVYLNTTCVYGGLNFIDAHIAGDFDFTRGLASFGMPADDHSKPGVALNFHDAKIGGDIRLADKFRAWGQVRMWGTQLGRSFIASGGEFSGAGETAIDAQRCQVGASVLMGGTFKAEGGVDMRRSRIGGDLDCDGGRFIAANVDALNADLVDIGDQVHLGDGFHAEGEVRLISAKVAGDVDCDNGHFLHADGDALSLDGAEIGRSLRIGVDGASESEQDTELPPGFVARGTVRLWGTKIDQDVLASGGRFESPEGTAILACNLCVASRVVLIAVQVQGLASFFSADIGHELDCRGAHFDATKTADQIAFLGNGMHIRGHLYCNQFAGGNKPECFRVDGQMSMQFATVEMHWDLHGAQLNHPQADALDASDCRIGGYVNLDTVAIDGRASFSRAKIDGMWILLNAVSPERTRLDMRFAHVWVIKDERLCDWPPAGQIQLEGLVYDHFDDDSPLSVEDRLAWLRRQYVPPGVRIANAESGATPIESAQARRRSINTGGQYVDRRTTIGRVKPVAYDESSEAGIAAGFDTSHVFGPTPNMVAPSEGEPESMSAPGMAAPQTGTDSNEPAPMAAAADSEPTTENVEGFEPAKQFQSTTEPDPVGRRYLTQPYTQLAAVYRAIGQDEQANAVLVARAQRIGELSPLLSAQGFWYRYLGSLIGYGYEPFRAIKIGVAIVLVGTIVFSIGGRRNLMAETKLAEQVLSQENEPRLVSATYPRFNPLVYSLDVFLPFVDLQQICYWLPGERLHGPRPSRNCLLHFGPWSLKWSGVLRTYFWFQTLAGWTLCTLLAAAVTGIVER